MKKLAGLEAIRGFAAIYVMLSHLNPFAGTALEPLFRFGQEAVILFFLVSGYVIYYSRTRSSLQESAFVFLYRRAIRIYPIFLISMALAALSALISGNSTCVNSGALLGNILMLQDVALLKSGTWVDPFCANWPLWSLSYEWWFYVAFAVLFIASQRLTMNKKRAIVAAMAILGTAMHLVLPAQPFLFASYFALWWAGLELAHESAHSNRTSFRGQRFAVSLLIACAVIWSIPVVNALLHGQRPSVGVEPALQLRHFITGIGLVFATIVASRRAIAPLPLVRFFGYLAPISYGLYATHQPTIHLVHSLGFGKAATVVITVALATLIAYVIEIILQPRIARILSPRRSSGTERAAMQH